MKYIVMALADKEEIFVFPRNVDHDRMFEACERIRFGGERDWTRKYLRDGECVAAGFIDDGQCHGKSETLGIKSRGAADTKLLAHFIRPTANGAGGLAFASPSGPSIAELVEGGALPSPAVEKAGAGDLKGAA